MYVRMKRVTDPLNEKVKARIVGRDGFDHGYVSSGSEHSAPAGGDVFSPTFNDLFFVDDEESPLPEEANYNDSDTERLPSSVSESSDLNDDLIKAIIARDQRDLFKKNLSAHVVKALQVFSCAAESSSKHVMQRNVMSFLRGFGYDVAICKTKWESSGGLTGGNHEFIDVVLGPERYFMSLGFASEFEIARPTDSYKRLLQCLPAVFVGKSEELRQILKVMSKAAKWSLKSRGLCLPPWRKHRFMQNKWLGPYRRTTNLFPATFSSVSQVNTSYAVKCRAVGFGAAVYGGGLWFPAENRT